MSVLLIVGTRPQIIKSAPIIYEAQRKGLDLKIIHTGQHYDYEMSKVFFEEQALPDPIVNLGVGSGSHNYQTAEIMLRLEKLLLREEPRLVLVPGDTNSALASALTAAKMGVPVAHVEAGARCYDMGMAEEINRRLIDHCSSLLFAVSKRCERNLLDEKVPGKVYLTGDTMYDSYKIFEKKANRKSILKDLNVNDDYAVLTLHRAENVDDKGKLKSIMSALSEVDLKIVFPIHPRTRKMVDKFGISLGENILKIEPIGYLEMISLLKGAKVTITDSGGLQKEAFWSGSPIVTLRERTEWVELVELGFNFLVGSNREKIVNIVNYIVENHDEIVRRMREVENPYGDGRASERIVDILTNFQP